MPVPAWPLFKVIVGMIHDPIGRLVSSPLHSLMCLAFFYSSPSTIHTSFGEISIDALQMSYACLGSTLLYARELSSDPSYPELP